MFTYSDAEVIGVLKCFDPDYCNLLHVIYYPDVAEVNPIVTEVHTFVLNAAS